jgi:hypothetical protein
VRGDERSPRALASELDPAAAAALGAVERRVGDLDQDAAVDARPSPTWLATPMLTPSHADVVEARCSILASMTRWRQRSATAHAAFEVGAGQRSANSSPP